MNDETKALKKEINSLVGAVYQLLYAVKDLVLSVLSLVFIIVGVYFNNPIIVILGVGFYLDGRINECLKQIRG